MTDETHLQKLLTIMAQLRNPVGGCPWDLEQTFASLARYTIEEAYEVADAAQRGHTEDLIEELGDLLLQVAFYSQIAQEQGLFTFEDVAERVGKKLVSRHPHVFGDETAKTANDVVGIWDARKDLEKAGKETTSVLDDVPATLPPLQRAEKMMKRVGKTGFKFPNAAAAKVKFEEELAEFTATPNKDEYGDVLFSFIAWARMAVPDETSSDEALDHANRKFEARFRAMEILTKSEKPETPEQWVALWNKAKAGL